MHVLVMSIARQELRFWTARDPYGLYVKLMLNDRKYIFLWQDPSPLIAVYLKLLLEEMENCKSIFVF